MITYNHELFIEEAIKGVLMQETSFTYQLIIGEDCGTDNTWGICEKYAKNYPDKIKLLPRPDSNLGMIPNFIRTLNACSGKYIALCEGDDYWTDSLKLEKQVDILENNPDIIVCHHWQKNAILSQNSYQEIESPKDGHGYLNQTKASVKEIFENKLRVKTRTMMCRNIIGDNFFPHWYHSVKFGDVPLNFLLGEHGDFYFIDEPMAVYRITESGVSTIGLKEFGLRKFKEQHYKNWIEIWDYANSHFNYKYDIEAKRTLNYFIKQMINNSRNPFSIYYYFVYKRNITGQKSFKTLLFLISVTFKKYLNSINRRIFKNE